MKQGCCKICCECMAGLMEEGKSEILAEEIAFLTELKVHYNNTLETRSKIEMKIDELKAKIKELEK